MPKKRITPGIYGRYGRDSRLPQKTSSPLTPKGLLGSREFFDLLRRRGRDSAQAIDALITKRCAQELSIMMCDSSGFSRKTNEHGILQFLSVMTRCYDKLIPLLEKRGGLCLSHNADNIMAIFTGCTAAVQAAIDMQKWLARRNKGLPDAEQFNICIGIHHGAVVRLKENIFGATVNTAAKVGEDMAGRNEILLTTEAVQRLSGRFKSGYLRSAEIGGKTFELHKIRY